MIPIKQSILNKIPDIRTKANLSNLIIELLNINVEHYDGRSQKEYFLFAEVVVHKTKIPDEVDIEFFTVENIIFFEGDGNKPNFEISIQEVVDAIENNLT